MANPTITHVTMRKTFSDWHGKEGITPENNELLENLTGFAATALFAKDADEINVIRCTLEAAFQVGRQAEREACDA